MNPHDPPDKGAAYGDASPIDGPGSPSPVITVAAATVVQPAAAATPTEDATAAPTAAPTVDLTAASSGSTSTRGTNIGIWVYGYANY